MNSIRYTSALEKFLSVMENLSDTVSPDVYEAVVDLCEILRIGRIEVKFYNNIADEKNDKFNHIVFFDSGNYDINVSVSKRAVSAIDNIAVYTAYHISETSEWSDDEKEKIDLIMRMLFVFNGRSRLLKIAERLTFFDLGMNLHNLNYYLRHIGKLCAQHRIGNFAAIYFNLKKFSIINQQIGRENGTVVMKKFIDIIVRNLSEDELIARLGGDNFLMLIYKDKLDSILYILSGESVAFGSERDERILVSAAAGVYIIPDNNSIKAPTDVMDRVSMAAHIARKPENEDVIYFNDKLMAKKEKDMKITAAFPNALENEEFLVYYQPKISLDGYHIAGAEALCRWQHNGSLVPPIEFIPVLEQGLDVCKLDFYMLEHVCRDIKRWLDAGKNVVKISVNFSRRHLTDMDLLEHILNIIDKYNIPHQFIEIELTETTTDVEFRDLKRVINGLQITGISTSVDDFGIGYSSLNLIKEIPWNVLKLDKSFLPEDTDGEKSMKSVMFRHVISMAQEMGLECIAEGVETKEQVKLLEENCCNFAQGFFFDKPLPVEEFEQRMDNYYYKIP